MLLPSLLVLFLGAAAASLTRSATIANMTLGDFLVPLRERFPKALVSDAAWDRLLASTAQLSAMTQSGIILELRLSDDDDQVDFSTMSTFKEPFEPRRSMMQELAREDRPAWLQRLVDASPVWQRIAKFAATEVAASESVDKQHAFADLWLEYDVAAAEAEDASWSLGDTVFGTPEPVPVPSIFLGPSEMTAPDAGDDEAVYAAWPETVDEFVADAAASYESLTGTAMTPALLGQLHKAILATPPGGELHQVGFWLSRKADFVRLIVMMPDIPCKDSLPVMRKYLEDVGYENVNHRDLVNLMRYSAVIVDKMVISIDITENGPGERLGFESFIEKPKPPKLFMWKRWLMFAEYLARVGIASRTKTEAIRDALGFPESGPRDKGIWVSQLRKSKGPAFRLHRAMNHIKTIFRPSRPEGETIEAKAYFRFQELPGGNKLYKFFVGIVGARADQLETAEKAQDDNAASDPHEDL